MTPSRTQLLLVRHGETPWNAAGRWQGHADPGLTERGLAQADALAEALRRALDHAEEPAWTRVIASDLARARETASRLAAALELPLEVDRRLRELDVGRWSGLTRDEIERGDAETLRRFEQGLPDVRPGGGESRVEIRERSHAFVRELAERRSGERIVIVTHLGVIRALVPGAQPSNTERIPVVAEEIAARPIDRVQRPEDGAL